MNKEIREKLIANINKLQIKKELLSKKIKTDNSQELKDELKLVKEQLRMDKNYLKSKIGKQNDNIR